MTGKVWYFSISVLVALLVMMQYQTLATVRDFTEKSLSNSYMAIGSKADTDFGSDTTAYPTGSDLNSNSVIVRLSKADINAIARELSMILQRNGGMTVVGNATKQTKPKEISAEASLDYYQESEQLVNSFATQGTLDNSSMSRLRELNSKISIEHKQQLLDKIIKLYEKDEISSDMLDYILM